MQTTASNITGTNRGIQPGMSAWSKESLTLHRSAKDVCKILADNMRKIDPRVTWRPALKAKDVIALSGLSGFIDETDINGIAPDGGIFMYEDDRLGPTPLFAVEAKHQQNLGNAIERWYKNYEVMKGFSPKFAYLTFCTGEGAAPGGVIRKTLNSALMTYCRTVQANSIREWNRLYSDGPSMFAEIDGFSVKSMREPIEKILNLKMAEIEFR